MRAEFYGGRMFGAARARCEYWSIEAGKPCLDALRLALKTVFN